MKSLLKLFGLAATVAQLSSSPALPGQAPPAPPPAKSAQPLVQLTETTFDFGKVKPTDTLRHDFIFANVGTADLQITNVQPACGCTTAGAWDRVIQPGKSGRIPILFNPASFGGPVSKHITVLCNDPVQPVHNLQIHATVWRPIEVEPQYVHFLMVEGEETNQMKVVRIVSNLDGPVTLETPRSVNPLFTAELKAVRPGREFELHVTCPALTGNSNRHGNIILNTTAPGVDPLNVTAVVVPQPALSTAPPQINLPPGPIAAGRRFPAMIRNNTSKPVQLSDPAVNAPGVTVQVQELEPGKTFKLDLTFPAGFQPQPGTALELTVNTTHPKYPVIKIPILQAAPPEPPAAPTAPVTDSK
jgi:hypothetical protein